MGCQAPKPSAALVYGRNLTDGSIAVALYNPADIAGFGEFGFSLLGWSSGTTASVRDLWSHKDLGEFTGRFPTGRKTVSIDAHATLLLRFTPKSLASAVVI